MQPQRFRVGERKENGRVGGHAGHDAAKQRRIASVAPWILRNRRVGASAFIDGSQSVDVNQPAGASTQATGGVGRPCTTQRRDAGSSVGRVAATRRKSRDALRRGANKNVCRRAGSAYDEAGAGGDGVVHGCTSSRRARAQCAQARRKAGTDSVVSMLGSRVPERAAAEARNANIGSPSGACVGRATAVQSDRPYTEAYSIGYISMGVQHALSAKRTLRQNAGVARRDPRDGHRSIATSVTVCCNGVALLCCTAITNGQSVDPNVLCRQHLPAVLCSIVHRPKMIPTVSHSFSTGCSRPLGRARDPGMSSRSRS